MRKRDAGIVLLAFVGVFLALEQESAISFRRGFTLTPTSHEGSERVSPPPVVTDLNGDGRNEIVYLVTPETLALVPSSAARRATRTWRDLSAPKVAYLTAPCIGLGVGYTVPEDDGSRFVPDLAAEAEKAKAGAPAAANEQMVVTVGEDFTVAAHDANLNTIWTMPLPVQYSSGGYGAVYTPRSAIVVVLPHAIFHGDQGMVIVGIEMPADDAGVAYSGADAVLQPDAFHPGNTSHATPLAGPRRFHLYCLHAADGAMRWERAAGDYGTRSAAGFEQGGGGRRVYETMSYKLTAHHIDAHRGDKGWLSFERALAASLPHRYFHPHHASATVHHFSRRSSSRPSPPAAAGAAAAPAAPVAAKARGAHAKGELGERAAALAGKLREWLQKRNRTARAAAAAAAVPAHPNALVVHLADAIEIIHLYSGHTVAELTSLVPRVLYDDLDGDGHIDRATATATPHSAPTRPRGALCRGAVFHGVHAGGGGAHAEMMWNGSICSAEPMGQRLAALKELVLHDAHTLADAHSSGGVGGGEFGDAAAVDADADATAERYLHANPAMAAAVPQVVHLLRTGTRGVRRLDAVVVFYTSDGLLTAVQVRRRRVIWQAETAATFTRDARRDAPTELAAISTRKRGSAIGHGGVQWAAVEAAHARLPHVVPFHFAAAAGGHDAYDQAHSRHTPTRHRASGARDGSAVVETPFVLALGDDMMAILSSATGRLQAEVVLEEAPVAPTVVADVNSDGVNDIIVICKSRMYVYLGRVHFSTSVVAIVLAVAAFALAALFVLQRVGLDDVDRSSAAFGLKRSTD